MKEKYGNKENNLMWCINRPLYVHQFTGNILTSQTLNETLFAMNGREKYGEAR